MLILLQISPGVHTPLVILYLIFSERGGDITNNVEESQTPPHLGSNIIPLSSTGYYEPYDREVSTPHHMWSNITPLSPHLQLLSAKVPLPLQVAFLGRA